MNFLLSARNRLAAARKEEAGFTMPEILVAISLMVILFTIIFLSLGGTLYPAQIMPMLQSASGTDLKDPQIAAKTIDGDIDAFIRQHPDTAPTTALLTAGKYLDNVPSGVVFAFHSYGGSSNPQRCVIAYLTDDTSSGFNVDNPAAFDSLYGSKSIGRDCRHQVAGSSNYVPNWDSE